MFQETLGLVGALPIVMKFSRLTYKPEIRLQAAKFIREMCHASPLTLQMFIACRGLPVLVEFLEHTDNQFAELKDIIFCAIDAILQVFNLPSTVRTPKNDFCRLFSKNKLMYHLSKVLINLTREDNPEYQKYLKKVQTIILLFSEAETMVKVHLAEEAILKRLFCKL